MPSVQAVKRNVKKKIKNAWNNKKMKKKKNTVFSDVIARRCGGERPWAERTGDEMYDSEPLLDQG